jgi:hypothetical protein
MGTAQSVEEDGKCPLPGKPFEATPNNVVRATQKAYNRMQRIEKTLSPEVGDTVPTSKNTVLTHKKENTYSPIHSSEITNKIEERPLVAQEGDMNPSLLKGIETGIKQRGDLNPSLLKGIETGIKQRGGMKYLKTLKVKELREVLKQNRIKITHKGKYLNKKQMIHKLKMMKWN